MSAECYALPDNWFGRITFCRIVALWRTTRTEHVAHVVGVDVLQLQRTKALLEPLSADCLDPVRLRLRRPGGEQRSRPGRRGRRHSRRRRGADRRHPPRPDQHELHHQRDGRDPAGLLRGRRRAHGRPRAKLTGTISRTTSLKEYASRGTWIWLETFRRERGSDPEARQARPARSPRPWRSWCHQCPLPTRHVSAPFQVI